MEPLLVARISTPAGSRPSAPRRRGVVAALLAVTALLATLFAVSTAASAPARASSASTLVQGQGLGVGQQLVSDNGMFRLVMQADGNLVQYDSVGWRWASWTYGNPGATLTFQRDGNLVIYSRTGVPLWHTHTWGDRAASVFVMQSDGNEVAYGPAGNWLWQSDTWLRMPPANGVALATARAQLGKPYVWAGSGPNAFDCSGLVMYSYAAAGISLYHNAQVQYQTAAPIPAALAQPGDIVFWHDSTGYVYHDGIYVSPGVSYAAIDESEGVAVQYYPSDVTYGSFTHR